MEETDDFMDAIRRERERRRNQDEAVMMDAHGMSPEMAESVQPNLMEQRKYSAQPVGMTNIRGALARVAPSNPNQLGDELGQRQHPLYDNVPRASTLSHQQASAMYFSTVNNGPNPKPKAAQVPIRQQAGVNLAFSLDLGGMFGGQNQKRFTKRGRRV